MIFHHRIRTIYAKELIDILRDRRTLIAMVVVPIVLYPLLMLGSVQAISYQTESLEEEGFRIGVVGETQKERLISLVQHGAAALMQIRARLDPDSEEAKQLPSTPLAERVEVVTFATREELTQAVSDRAVQIGVVLENERLVPPPNAQNDIEIHADLEEVRSGFAQFQFNEMIGRFKDRIVDNRKRQERLPLLFDRPFNVTVTDLSAPSSILGQILPLILVLLTITGAIYPAIDLTAGERERGTLESLMVSPVPIFDLIVGKFLVVTTVAIMGATLNLAAVSATVYFGGFDKVIASSEGAIPYATMFFILLCLIPFAVLMSAIMIAVCSYARTFKEAQNYVTPVILAVLIPGGVAALPTTELEGVMLVVPVANMVLLARDLLLGAVVPWWNVLTVLLATTLYAGAAVAVAASVFGTESVVFADAGSWKTMFSRSLRKPAPTPPVALGLIVVALLFPTWFFIQSALSPGPEESAAELLYASGWLMPLLFVLLPVAILRYAKVDIATTLALRMPSGRYVLAAVLVGVSAWVPAQELSVVQGLLFGVPQVVTDSADAMAETLAALPASRVFVLIALVPAISEELLFRGLLLWSLSGSARKWTAIIVSAAVFGVFHFFLFKFAISAALGVVLGYICWQSRSIVPAMVTHFLHNAIGAITVINPNWTTWIGLSDEEEWVHFPPHVLIPGCLVFVVGLVIASQGPTANIVQTPRPIVDRQSVS
ncbi:MAG: ABC transporter permease subunit/CPBP intramembrane protease [Planctomycetota bacterium]|jgi:ABC-2 type transport system permease protein/sodium transport system permease protein